MHYDTKLLIVGTCVGSEKENPTGNESVLWKKLRGLGRLQNSHTGTIKATRPTIFYR